MLRMLMRLERPFELFRVGEIGWSYDISDVGLEFF